MRLVTSQNQGDRGKSREGRSHCRHRAGLGAGGTAVGLHSQGAFSCTGTFCKEPASLFWLWLWLCAYSWSRPHRPLQPWPAKLRQTLRSSTRTQVQVRGAGQRGSQQGWRPSLRPILRGALERDGTKCILEVGAGSLPLHQVVRLWCRLLDRHLLEPTEPLRSSQVKKHWKRSTQSWASAPN